MKKLYFIIAVLSIFFLSCNSEMLSDVQKSMEDPRVPEINVKQGQNDIPYGTEFSLSFANGAMINEDSEPTLFTIENIGTADLLFTEIIIEGDDSDEFSISQNPDPVILPGTSSTFSIIFNPSDTAEKTAAIIISTNDFDEAEFSFTVTGRSKPVPGFSARIKYGPAPLSVAFENISQGAETYEWNFGDGTTSAEENPVHLYTDTGTYMVELRTTGPGGFDYTYINDYINVYRSKEFIVDNYLYNVKAMRAGKINDDDYMDIVAVSDDTDTLVWYKNDSAGNFSKNTITSDPLTEALAVGKIDNDDYIDIATATAWWENDGTGTSWTKHSSYSTTNNSILLADIDNDSDLDVISSSINYEIAWWQNGDNASGSGDGLFINVNKKIIETTFSFWMSYYAYDIDLDGDMDIIATGRDAGEVAWWQNGGDDSGGGDGSAWTKREVDSEILWPLFVSAADINGDGWGDIIVAASNSQINEITWYENDKTPSDGTIGTAHTLTTNFPSATWTNTADMDGDGDIDIIAAEDGYGKVAWWENPLIGNNTEWIERTVAVDFLEIHGLAAEDFNGDGYKDIASCAYSLNAIKWWDLNLTGWEKYSVDDSFSFPQAVYSSDIDNDGDVDIMAASEGDDLLAVWENNGLGDMGSGIILSDDFTDVRAVYSADLDNDGYGDIIGAGGGEFDPGVYAWYRNNGNSTFTEHIIGSSMDYNYAIDVVAADLDNDGDKDVIGAASQTHLIHYFLNDGSGTFGSGNLVNAALCTYVLSIFAADINKDGDIDILSASYSNTEIAWWENDGNLLNGVSTDDWTKHTIDGSFTNAKSIFSIDIDGDGDNDVIASPEMAIGEIALWINDGTGTFGARIIVDAAFPFPTCVDSADINGDGHLDIIASSSGSSGSKYQDGRIAWWEGDGTGDFGTRQILSIIRWPVSISTNDFDGDGDIDVAGASRDAGGVSWWSNNLIDWGI